MKKSCDPFWNLVATARRLQRPGGCPWDRAQTVQSLLPHLLEEVYEVFCAARLRRRGELEEELGDALYTIVFLALVAERQGWFDVKSLLEKTLRKMVRRHPHVFGSKRAKTAHEAYEHWQAVKRRERSGASSQENLRYVLVWLCETLRTRPGEVKRMQRLLGGRARIGP